MSPTPRASFTRRQFVQGSSAAAFAIGFGSCASTSIPRPAPRGPNEEVRVAVVGLRSRGKNHVDGYRRLANVRVVALVDVDERVLAGEQTRLEAAGGEKVQGYRDLRHVLDRADVDAISVATPNHWHALQAVWACQAGKDVYLEKPVSHNVWEGRQIVEAARKYHRIVQTGTQSRSSEAIAEATAWLREGELGEVQLARGLCYKPRKSIGKVRGPQAVPEGVDYDLWCGPASDAPLARKNLHYDWHWIFETGNGDLGNQGIHQMDIARWVLGEERLSPVVLSVGGRFGYDDDGDTPNTLIAFHDYRPAPLFFEVRGLPTDEAAQADEWGMDRYLGVSIGVIVHCEGGYLRIPDYRSAIAHDPTGKEIRRWQGASDHYANFIDAVRSRRREDLTADIEQGHVSSSLCHTGNISFLVGQRAGPEEAREALREEARASETFERFARHLAANEVDVSDRGLVLGARLRMNPRAERFRGNDAANALLTRDYRAPYVVPARV